MPRARLPRNLSVEHALVEKKRVLPPQTLTSALVVFYQPADTERSPGLISVPEMLSALGRCRLLQDRATPTPGSCVLICEGCVAHQRCRLFSPQRPPTSFQDVNFHRCNKIPSAAWQQLSGADWPQLTKASFKGRLGLEGGRGVWEGQERVTERVTRDAKREGKKQKGREKGERPPLRLRCFIDDTQGAEGAAALLSALGRCRLLQDRATPTPGSCVLICEGCVAHQRCRLFSPQRPPTSFQDVNFDRCFKIPSAAWQQLSGADWPQLTKASFKERLGLEGGRGVWEGQERVTRDAKREGKKQKGREKGERPSLRLRCFDADTQGAEGAAALLSALGRCRLLQDRATPTPGSCVLICEGCVAHQRCRLFSPQRPPTSFQDVNFDRCFKIPSAAWQQLSGADWPQLTKASFKERLGLEGGRGFGRGRKGSRGTRSGRERSKRERRHSDSGASMTTRRIPKAPPRCSPRSGAAGCCRTGLR